MHLRGAGDVSSTYILVIHMGDTEGVPGSEPWPGPVPAIVATREVA